MANYADLTRTRRTLIEGEQRTLLKVTGEHRAGYRDLMLYAMALSAGLSEHEATLAVLGLRGSTTSRQHAGNPAQRVPARKTAPIQKREGRGRWFSIDSGSTLA